MTNEMKLLMAMCDALGFEVETTLDYQETITYRTPQNGHNKAGVVFSTDNSGAYIIDDDGKYKLRLETPIVDYKLTKREE